MKVRLSNLAARYYRKSGWTPELLAKYLVKGSFLVQDEGSEGEYYILDVGGAVDAQKMLADFPDLEVEPYPRHDHSKTALELLESRNW